MAKVRSERSRIIQKTIQESSMSAYWLKIIGTSEGPCPGTYAVEHADFKKKPRHMQSGDLMVLYAVGGWKCVFAIAQVDGPFYASGVERWPFRVKIKYLVNLPVSSGVSIEKVNDERDLCLSLRRRSFLELSAKEYENAATKLRAVAESKLRASKSTQS
jgi:hypothetical protein